MSPPHAASICLARYIVLTLFPQKLRELYIVRKAAEVVRVDTYALWE